VIPAERAEKFADPMATTVIKWGKVWGLSVFVVLTLLPAAIMRRRNSKTVREPKHEGVDVDEQKVGVAADAKAPI
jgi:hypothetical protein